MDEFNLTENFQPPSQSQVQLGSLHFGIVKVGKYTNKKFLIRKLVVKRLSQYIIEEMNKNIQEYRNLSCKHLQTIKAISFDQDNVYFFMPYFPIGNLNTLITSKEIIPEINKKQIITQITIAMNYLYSQKTPIPHGHLIPNNIMMTPSGDIKVKKNQDYIQSFTKIIDFGLAPMKKYISLTSGYTTKCSYTAPELLKDRSQTPYSNQSADVYSFGIIVWEIFHQKQAFKGTPLQELFKIVAEDKKRPKIDEKINIDIITIIRACWQDQQDKRPKFSQILQILNKDIYSFDL